MTRAEALALLREAVQNRGTGAYSEAEEAVVDELPEILLALERTSVIVVGDFDRDAVFAAIQTIDPNARLVSEGEVVVDMQRQPPVTDQQLLDLLGLVESVFRGGCGTPDLDVIRTWSAAEREAAATWAGAVHLHASDNDDVVVPPVPPVLVAYVSGF